jgi:glutathione S-transferase
LIKLWELRGKGGRRYSLFSWRTRMALAHKGLAFDTQPVCMSDKQAIAFSGGKTVPVIRDGETVVRDSWKIAEHLEDHYPDKPLFGGAIGRGVTQTFNTWVDRTLVVAMLAVIVSDIHERVDPADEQFFRQMMEGILKRSLEEAREKREDALRRLGSALEPLQAALKRQPYACGQNPAYADYILFSVFQWARVMSPQEVLGPESPLCSWRERLLDLYDGFARNVPIA